MKCNNCGNEFEGNFCPSCGANYTSVSTQSSQPKKKSNKKRNIVFISIAIVAFLVIGVIVGITNNNNIEKAKAYIEDGKYSEVQEILDKFINSDTTDERIYIVYSDLHIAQQEYLEALDILETGKNKCSSTERIQEKLDSINTTYSSEITTLKAEQKRIQDEQAAAQAIADANEAEKKRLEDEAKQKQDQLDKESKLLKIGDMITSFSGWEITVDSIEIKDRVADNEYFGYTPDEGNRYVVVNLTVKNVSKDASTFYSSFSFNTVGMKIVYDDKYEYSSSMLITIDNDLHDKTLNPLTSVSGFIAFSVTEEALSSDAPLTLKFTHGLKTETYNISSIR